MEYKVYRERWLILLLICIWTCSRSYMITCFAVMNPVITRIFQTSPMATDILTSADTIGAVFVCLVVIFAENRVGVRIQTLVISSSLLLSAVTSAITFMNRKLYWLVVSGRVIGGLAGGLLYVLPAVLAANWFPQNEVAKAFALPVSSLALGSILSGFVFPLTTPVFTSNITTVQTENITNDVDVGFAFTKNFSLVAGILALSTLIAGVVAKDHPPTPPSAAQEKLMNKHNYENNPSRGSPRSALLIALKVIRNPSFINLTVANVLLNASLTLGVAMGPALVAVSFPRDDEKLQGYVIITGFIGGMIGGLVVGVLVDKFKRFKLLTILGTATNILVNVAILLGHLYKNLPILLVFYGLLNFCRAFTLTTVVEFLKENTYPLNNHIVMCLHFAPFNISFFVFTLLERAVLDLWGTTGVASVCIISSMISLLLVSLLKANYNRSAVKNKVVQSEV